MTVFVMKQIIVGAQKAKICRMDKVRGRKAAIRKIFIRYYLYLSSMGIIQRGVRWVTHPPSKATVVYPG